MKELRSRFFMTSSLMLVGSLVHPNLSSADTSFNALMPEVNCHMKFTTTTPRAFSVDQQMLVARVVLNAYMNTPGVDDEIPDPKKEPAKMPTRVVNLANLMLGNAYSQSGDIAYKGLQLSNATIKCP